MMRYNIQIPGDGYVYITGKGKVRVREFAQTIIDVDKSEGNRFFGYGGE